MREFFIVGDDDKRGGIGILKGLFERIAKDQRPRGGFNPQTLLSDMREFLLRIGSDGPIFHGLGPHGMLGTIKSLRPLGI